MGSEITDEQREDVKTAFMKLAEAYQIANQLVDSMAVRFMADLTAEETIQLLTLAIKRTEIELLAKKLEVFGVFGPEGGEEG